MKTSIDILNRTQSGSNCQRAASMTELSFSLHGAVIGDWSNIQQMTGSRLARMNDTATAMQSQARCLAALLIILLFWLISAVVASASDNIETAGDILQLVLPATAGGLTLGFRDWEGSFQLAESSALTLGVTYGLKYTVHETRPNGGSQSFPSAHSSISFSAAEFMRKRYGWEYGIPAYAAASFVAYSRVEAGAHHPHDVIAGAGIGIISSYIFTRPYKGWHVEVEADGKFYGLSFSHPW